MSEWIITAIPYCLVCHLSSPHFNKGILEMALRLRPGMGIEVNNHMLKLRGCEERSHICLLELIQDIRITYTVHCKFFSACNEVTSNHCSRRCGASRSRVLNIISAFPTIAVLHANLPHRPVDC